MTAVVNNSDHAAAASKLLWGRDTSTLGGTARAGGGGGGGGGGSGGIGVGGGGSGVGGVANKGDTSRLGTQTWAPSSRMTRSQGVDQQHQQGGVAVDKALVQVAGKELGNKHTWPRRRDVSFLREFFLPLFWENFSSNI